MSNIIRFADNLVRSERETKNERNQHFTKAMKQEGPTTEVGEQVWIGEHTSQGHPTKVSKGEKTRMTAEEVKHFYRTIYVRGFAEYHYEGNIRLKEGQKYSDKVDPRRGARDGEGILKYPMGETYEGEWRSGRRHGKGIFQTPNRYVFAGTYVDDLPHGSGTECFPCGSYYVGPFFDGLPEGKGVLLFGSSLDDPNAYRFEGNFKDGMRNGSGAIFYPNGDIFSGIWKNGMRDGEGITTSVVKGEYVSQHRTVWANNKMIGTPVLIDKCRFVPPPKPTAHFTSATTVIPADLTTWTVKHNEKDLSLAQFQRIKMGFEQLDVNCTGSILISDLKPIWGRASQEMLNKLCNKLSNSGRDEVQLIDIFESWYPQVPGSIIESYMVQDIAPRDLLRFRGILCGKMSYHLSTPGYLQLVGCKAPDDEDDLPIKQSHLENAGFEIGGSKFTLAMYETARNLCDPPHFAEVLEISYPNISRATLGRYEMEHIPKEDFYQMCEQFILLSHKEDYLYIDNFEEAEKKFQSTLKAQLKAERDGIEYKDISLNPSTDPIQGQCVGGFFKWQPHWKLGSINLTVSLLRAIDKYDPKVNGTVTLAQILRYCYPNVRCLRSQELLMGNKVSITLNCKCLICALN